jgi:hypothetical protein
VRGRAQIGKDMGKMNHHDVFGCDGMGTCRHKMLAEDKLLCWCVHPDSQKEWFDCAGKKVFGENMDGVIAVWSSAPEKAPRKGTV